MKSMALASHGVLACLLAVFAIAGVATFPEYQVQLGAALLVYTALLFRFPLLWTYVLVFVTVAVNLAPWTGRYVIDELDFFTAITVAVLAIKYWRVAGPPLKAAALPIAFVALLVIKGYDASWLDTFGPTYTNFYFTALNGLVVTKGPFWALLLSWLYFKQLQASREQAVNHLHNAFVMGALTLFAIVLWERQIIPTLISDADLWTKLNKISDFTSAYRSTGVIAGMHTGGESIDGIYITFLPFVFSSLLFAKSTARKALSFIALAGLLYCVLVGFTRTTYAASFAAILACTFVYLRCKLAQQPADNHGNGLRQNAALAAALRPYALSIAGAVLLLAGTFIAYKVAGYYVVLGGAFVVFVFTVSYLHFKPDNMQRYIGLGVASMLYMGFIFKSYSDSKWVEFTVANSMTLLISGIVVVAGTWLAASRKNVLTGSNGIYKAIAFSLAFTLVGGVLVTALGSTRMAIRSETTGTDLLGRMQHWQSVLNSGTWNTNHILTGQGPGTFPANYALTYPERINKIGYAEFSNNELQFQPGADVMVGQRFNLVGKGHYQLALKYKSNENVNLTVAICRRNLMLFERWGGDCGTVKVSLAASISDAFKTVDIDYTRNDSILSLPAILTLRASKNDAEFTITGVSLKDGFGAELLDNTDFVAGMDNWYFYYDFEHLAWHIKNLYVSQFYQFGLVGVLLFFGMALTGIAKNGASVNFNSAQVKTSILGGITAYLAFGTFGDPLDSARAAVWFFILLFASQYSWQNTNTSKLQITK